MTYTVIDKRRAEDNLRETAAQQQKDFNALSNEQKAVKKAEAFLDNSIAVITPGERLFLSYLQRKFDLQQSLGADEIPIVFPQSTDGSFQEADYLARIAYPERLFTATPGDTIQGGARTNVYSANCDILGLPSDYWQTMRQGYEAGGYTLTHVVLAITFMRDNGCEIPAVGNELFGLATQGMIALMDDPASTYDLRYEVVAFLQMSGQRELVKKTWIEEIVTNQREDGSWVSVNGDNRPSAHTTILGLWALLEHTNPDKPYEPLIRRPSQNN